MAVNGTHTDGKAMNEQSKKMDGILQGLGVKTRVTKVYGSQCTVECHSRKMAEKAAMILQKGTFKIRGITEDSVHAKENKGTVLCPTTIKVWRVYATVAR